MTRRLSKRRRTLLWVAAGGKCQNPECGAPLDQSFHADHITPFRITRDTNIHDMQALCPRCNLQKGGRVCR